LVQDREIRMHTACRDLVREDFEATHRRRLINPKTANDNTPWEWPWKPRRGWL
jgi:hypothetical protein